MATRMVGMVNFSSHRSRRSRMKRDWSFLLSRIDAGLAFFSIFPDILNHYAIRVHVVDRKHLASRPIGIVDRLATLAVNEKEERGASQALCMGRGWSNRYSGRR